MSEAEVGAAAEVDVDTTDAGYVPPAPKPLSQIIAADEEDESLKQYKAQLLGGAAGGGDCVIFPDDPRHVIVQKLTLLVDGDPYKELNLTDKLEDIKKAKFTLKEGCKFRIKVDFYVQRDIVTGLKYVQKTSRMGITVDKLKHMVGSYGPREEIHSFTTPEDVAPSGMTARGSYSVHSLFTDDDQKEHLKWEWNIEVKKEWDA